MSSFEQQWTRWHDEHETRRADKHGFLAITGLHWLTETPQRFPDAPGEWSTGPEGVLVTLAPGEELDGIPAGEHRFPPLAERADHTVGWGEAKLEIARRGGHDVLRPRHPAHETLVGYRGTPAYPPAEEWVVTGTFVPFDEPRPVTVGSVAEGLEHVYESPGRIEFTADGRDLALTAFNGHTPGSLFVLFTDATSGVTTYPANRSVAIAPPAADGTVTLDFNRATNLPCAYTEFATCPLPPAENRLPIAVAAGEQLPR
ncbi:hypothetical protein ACWT_2155 [Actinoplanes sp. SE50]|uniref:DUF1684 domain-containing protein n=1 Tax=unclassified Actinoplanes TaxID=2626549 RepID=UPI00023ECAD6|nr:MULTISPECIES: DUF1684 domain-containing protein [unclassified Actinoplanes]AEV83177.1 hypothetical protein ACPL_2280 [Actinoplanes sp. SE50/110]ATO81570.1 hypothetical protein ACWT_2155 [Actinoplanes sp. SE50]SLL98978.1 uncharacterized protein ACSP50_2206 [Actinoplanes sp. SE50/110]